MSFPREILERIERLKEFHRSTKDAHPPKPPPVPANRPNPHRRFDLFPKTALPTNLVGVSTPTVSLLTAGVDVVPESQLRPKQDLRTLASWLYLAHGILPANANFPPRTCPSNGNAFPCEVYVAAFGIDGLEPGFYHYSPREFSLRKLREGWETLAQLKRGRPDLDYLKTVPAALLVTTIYCRSTWRYRKRGYRVALLDAGHLAQNLATVAAGLGVQTLVRLRMTDSTTRELIGLPPDVEFGDAESVQAMITWADRTQRPLPPPLPTAAPAAAAHVANGDPLAGLSIGGASPGALSPGAAVLETIPREPLAHDIVGYGSVMAAHEDCVAPGVAVREVRPPLSDASPVSKEFVVHQFPEPDDIDGGTGLSEVLLRRQPPPPSGRLWLGRSKLWNLCRVGFRTGTYYPLMPDGPCPALVRPFWVIQAVTGMDEGVWYYHPQKDGWCFMRGDNLRTDTQYVAQDDPVFGDAAAVCILVANFNRLLNEGGPDIYRLAHLEAGVVAHRMRLAAAAWGLGFGTAAAFYDEDARALLGLEKTGWEPLYMIAVGPYHHTDGTPDDAPSVGDDAWRD